MISGIHDKGTPLTVTLNGEVYYYCTNMQGDVLSILNSARTVVVAYTYDAWGRQSVVNGSLASTLGFLNPLRYRGYVYDLETQLYYLQSRYYNPQTGRFIIADEYPTTGQGLTGNNMFAYCGNNPVSRADDGGEFWNIIIGAAVGGAISLVSSVVSELIEGEVTWTDIGQIAISTTIGIVEGAAIAAVPAAATAISAVSSVVDTAVNGLIDGDSAEEIVVKSLVSGAIGAVAGSGGSDFVKGGKIINNAAESIGNIVKKGVHPLTKKSSKRALRDAAKYIGDSYISGQIEDFAYAAIEAFCSFYTLLIIENY